MPKKITVMLVDDSAVVRQVLQAVLEQDPDIEVIGAASDPIFALNKLQQRWPDVIVSDVEMPRMDGITFLKHIMSEHPTPVVICSSLTEKNTELTMSALASGAVGVITKPKIGVKNFLKESSDELISAVKGAANANVKTIKKNAEILENVPPKHTADAVLSGPASPLKQTTDHVVVIGTSTGGTQALEVVLRALPRVCTGIVVVQHMPEKFTASFASRLDSLCELDVKEAENNDRVMPGRVLIAPGGRHMVLKRNGARYHVEIIDGPLVNRHKPSVDVLFRSAAKYAGKNALGIIMTGMGDDGAKGLYEMRMAGAPTIAQDEKTCVVYGMPREAVKLGAVEKVLPLDHIANAIKEF